MISAAHQILIKLRIKWAGHVERMEERTGVYRVLGGET